MISRSQLGRRHLADWPVPDHIHLPPTAPHRRPRPSGGVGGAQLREGATLQLGHFNLRQQPLPVPAPPPSPQTQPSPSFLLPRPGPPLPTWRCPLRKLSTLQAQGAGGAGPGSVTTTRSRGWAGRATSARAGRAPSRGPQSPPPCAAPSPPARASPAVRRSGSRAPVARPAGPLSPSSPSQPLGHAVASCLRLPRGS